MREQSSWRSACARRLGAAAVIAMILLMAYPARAARALPASPAPDAKTIKGLVDKGDLKHAERLARARIDALERGGHGGAIDLADALDLLIEVLDRKGFRTPREVSVARRAAEIRLQAEGETTAYARTLYTYARWLHWLGRELESRARHEEVLAVRERILSPDHPDIGVSLNALGTVAARLGEWETARSYYERALEHMARSLGFGRRETRVTLFNLAELHEQMGDYASVRELYSRLAQDMESRRDPAPLVRARALSWIGEMDVRLGDDASARASYELARQDWLTARRQPELLGRVPPSEQANTLTRLATTAKAIGQFDQARGFYFDALQIRERLHGPNHHAVAWVLTQLARLLHDQGDSPGARPFIDRACRILSGVGLGSPDHLVSCLGLQCTIMREMGEAESARGLIIRALELGQTVIGVGHPDFWQLLVEQARIGMVTGHPDEALRQALRAEGLAARHFRRTAAWLSQDEALRYDKERTNGLDVALSVLAAAMQQMPRQGGASNQGVESAWDAVIRSRGIVLDELIARRRISSIAADRRLEGLARRLEADRSRLAHVVTAGPDDEDSSKYAGNVRSLMKRQEATEREFALLSAVFRRLLAEQDAGFTRVVSELPRDTALVAYVQYSRFLQDGKAFKQVPSYMGFVKGALGGPPVAVPLGDAATIDDLVARWRRSAGTPPQRGLHPSRAHGLDAEAADGEHLRRAIWDPLERHLGGGGRALVVPDGALNQVNLAALPGSDGKFLVESSRLFHYLSAEKDLLDDERPTRGKGLVALGAPDFDSRGVDGPGPIKLVSRGPPPGATNPPLPLVPLPQSRTEVEQVAALWNGKARLVPGEEALQLIGTGATEDRLRRQIEGRQVVHLATHGIFEDGAMVRRSAGAHPLLASGLALAGANVCLGPKSTCDGSDDGVLLGEEILSLNLSGVEWVVLSACNTGLGPLQAREGVQGLRRCFQGAGAATVITTLWEVDDDAARDWMHSLYGARLGGLATAESMRRASLDAIAEARRKDEHPHSYFWGGFVAFGDWR